MMNKHFCDQKFRSLLAAGSVTIVIQYLLLLSDTVVIGNILGEQYLAAVNVIKPFLPLSLFFASLFSIGTSVFYSYEAGRFNRQRANALFGQGVILEGAAGILLFLAGLLGKKPYFAYLDLSPQTAAWASDYFFYCQFVILLLPVYTVLLELVYADGDDLICNLSSLLQMVVNLVCSVVLCFRMGIRGVGLGTLLGLGVSIVVLLFHFFRKQNTLKFVWHLSLGDTLQTLKCGLTDAAAYLFMGLTSMIASKFVIGRFGESYLSVLLVVFNILDLTIIFDGIGQAVTPLVNVYRGEQNQPGIRRMMKTAFHYAIGEGVAMTLLLFLFGGQIAVLFGLKDAALVDAARLALRLVSPFFFCTALLFLQTTYYMIIEKIALATAITGLKDWLVPSACLCGLGAVLGITGVWIGLGLAPLLSALLSLLFVYVRYGKERFPLLLPPDPKQVRIFDAQLSPQSVMQLRDQVEEFLTGAGISPRGVNRAMLFVEEVGMMTAEHNRGKKVCCECSVMIGPTDVEIILRDDGVTFDPTDADNQVLSLRSYVVASLMLHTRDKRSLVTTGYNRSMIRFEK